MLDFLNSLVTDRWEWYVVGPVISLCMFLLLYFGREFGVSASLRAGCAALGAGKYSSFFVFYWKSQKWNFMFVLGTILGGFVSTQFLNSNGNIGISEATKADLTALGFTNPGVDFLPAELFSISEFGIGMFLFLIVGGFLIGFGARYAGGCTSGHAISGLSNLQVPSLIAVCGFFIGGLAMTYFIFPTILKLLL